MKYQFNWIHTDPQEDKKDCKYRIDKNKCDIKKKKCNKCPFYVKWQDGVMATHQSR